MSEWWRRLEMNDGRREGGRSASGFDGPVKHGDGQGDEECGLYAWDTRGETELLRQLSNKLTRSTYEIRNTAYHDDNCLTHLSTRAFCWYTTYYHTISNH